MEGCPLCFEDYFQSKILVNTFIADKVLIKLDDNFSDMVFDGRWRIIGDFHLKVESWSYFSLKRKWLIETMQADISTRLTFSSYPKFIVGSMGCVKSLVGLKHVEDPNKWKSILTLQGFE